MPESEEQRAAKLRKFVRESNRIERILNVRQVEVRAHDRLLALRFLTVEEVERFVMDVAGARMRDQEGHDVGIFSAGRLVHRPPSGGPAIREALADLLHRLNVASDALLPCDLLDPWAIHAEYETLHPFEDGNGRSGRAIWAWHMRSNDRDPFALPFLHAAYYQALGASRT